MKTTSFIWCDTIDEFLQFIPEDCRDKTKQCYLKGLEKERHHKEILEELPVDVYILDLTTEREKVGDDWNVRGRTYYLYNNNKGLQVVLPSNDFTATIF